MRFKMAIICGLSLISLPVLAQNYSVQPLQSSVPNPPKQAPIIDEQIPVTDDMAPSKPVSDNLKSAVSCSAVLQIAALAAPEWSSENGVANATNLWLERVFTLADKEGITGDKVNDLVKKGMEAEANSSVSNPASLNKKAFDCATNPPA